MLLKLKPTYLFTVFFIALMFAQVRLFAFSYVYIQGDKQTPFYVKLDGEMQPRYGKNYCIIPQLAPGTLQLEILFQQNEYPPEKFTIKVPANGYRGFMLTKKDGAYALYDLQQRFYLPPGNDIEDDVMPVAKAVVQATTTEPESAARPVAKKATATNSTNTKPVKKTIQPEPTEINTNQDPRFIDNIELNNERTFQNEAITKETTENTSIAEIEPISETVGEDPVKNGVSNSDCPKPISNSNYREILEKAKKRGDKNRLKYLLEQTDNCYTTIQVRALARSLSNDPERYTFLKEVYPRVTDQSSFPSLVVLFASKEWKDYFKLILP